MGVNASEPATQTVPPPSPAFSCRWPLLLGGIFLAFLLFSSWAIIQAGTRGSPVVDHDYYARGQAYHEHDRAWRAAAEAGWRVLLAREGELLQVRLVDGEGRPVAGGEVMVRASRRDNGTFGGISGGTSSANPGDNPGSNSAGDPAGNPETWQIVLPERSPGVYRLQLADFPDNQAEFVLSAATAEARLTRRFRVSADQWREMAL